MGSRFSNGLEYQMPCGPLNEFREIETHSRVRGGCHVLIFSGRGMTDGDRRVLPTCVISTLEAKRLFLKGCESYLAHVVDTSVTEVKLENVSVVCEFPNVFLEDLPRLPPNRELEFGIKVLLGSTPISIPSYRMAPMELKELKTQLQDLMDKGFIRPSVSL